MPAAGVVAAGRLDEAAGGTVLDEAAGGTEDDEAGGAGAATFARFAAGGVAGGVAAAAAGAGTLLIRALNAAVVASAEACPPTFEASDAASTLAF